MGLGLLLNEWLPSILPFYCHGLLRRLRYGRLGLVARHPLCVMPLLAGFNCSRFTKCLVSNGHYGARPSLF